VKDNATVQTVFANKQPFKGVEKYFTNALLYQETDKVAKEQLLEDDDRDNEADLKSEEDTPATLAFKPIVAYLNDLNVIIPLGMMTNG